MTTLKLSSRLDGVAESSTLKMNAAARELAAKGHKVVNLTAGEPDFPVLDPVKDAAIAAITGNFNKYTPAAGIPELRKGLTRKFEKDNGLAYTPEDIIVTVGAKQAIFNFLLATINSGDEVIIPGPYWVSYPDMVKLAGGWPVTVDTDAKAGFKLTPAQLKGALTPKTRALILNAPSNPTGVVYTRGEMQALAKVLEGTDVWVVSDEIYEKLIFEGEFTSFAALSPDAFKRTLTVNGFSKTYSMTGWRLGYAAGPKPLIAAMALLQGQSTSGANSVAQRAALAALDLPDSAFKPMVEAFRRRRDRMAEIFSAAGNFSFVKPAGAFYFFLNVEQAYGKAYNHDQVLTGSEDLAFYLLNAAHVGTVPGNGFGADAYLRLSFAVSDSDVEEGSKRIVDAIAKLR
ncbi:MAG: pyridoxal phosphate-dependent aminotransferase [Deltaproteobacteria bacterium]|nr:pyridoxal phosphate-dependent aminotransferase [Deltaproteobacteria bacterium]